MLLFDVVGICFEGARNSLLLLICLVVLLFWCLETNLLSVCLLSLVPSFFGFVVFSVRALFVFFVFVFLLVWCFFNVGSALFLFNSLRRLGIVFPSLLCLHVASCTSCLGCSCVCVGFWAAFLRELSGGRLGMANREGSIYFAACLTIGVFGWKQALSPRVRVFANVFCFKNVHVRSEDRRPFSICRGKCYKNRGFRFLPQKCDPPLFTFFIF